MKLIFGVINSILALSILAWPIGLLGSIFMFDAPGSRTNLITIALALSIIIYPIPVLTGVLGYWKNRKEAAISILRNYTLVGLVAPATILFLIWLLDAVCQGKFACN